MTAGDTDRCDECGQYWGALGERADDIVRALADCEPTHDLPRRENGVVACALCDAYSASREGLRHAYDCPWQQARLVLGLAS